MEATARLVGALERCLRPLEGIGRGLIVAVSGGPDSVALARAAVLARRPGPGAPLVLAHLNHLLRGAESDGDEEFVAALHAGLAGAFPGLELCRGRVDAAADARREGANVEAAARRLRYGWLAEVARARGIRWVATGHTADDQAETVLHRLLRGTGLRGLRGIAPRRRLARDVDLARPLLGVTRAEVLAFLRALGQPFREDSSNRDLRRTRNRIRHELLPHLAARYNPAAARVLARLAAQADEAYRDEEAAVARLLREAERPRAGTELVFDRPTLAAAPRRLVREAFRLVWAREGWPTDAMGRAGWERLAALACEGGRAADLPGHVRARVRPRVLLLGRHAPPAPPANQPLAEPR